MALAQCIALPCTFTSSRKYPLGLGGQRIIPLCPSSRVHLRCDRDRRDIRCSSSSAESGGETSGQQPGPDAKSRVPPAAAHPPSWEYVAKQLQDEYEGWEPLDRDHEIDRRKGLLLGAAGVALAIALSVVTYFVYSKKGFKHSAVQSVTTQFQRLKDSAPRRSSVTSQLQRLKDLVPRKGSDDSEEGHIPSDSDTSVPPSSNETQQEVPAENPRANAVSSSEPNKLRSVTGQESLPKGNLTMFGDEENDFSFESMSDSDAEFDKEGHSSYSKGLDEFTSTPEGVRGPANDGVKPTSSEKKNDESSGEKSLATSPSNPVSASDLTKNTRGKSESPKEDGSQSSMNGHFGTTSGSPESRDTNRKGSDGSRAADKAKKENSPSVVDPAEPMLSFSAKLAVPKGIEKDVLEIMGLDPESSAEPFTMTTSEPILVKESSVLEKKQSYAPEALSELVSPESVKSFGVPAPSTPSAAAAQAKSRGVLVPATIDHEQEQAVAALQSLKVIEAGAEARGLCTRREYARWLIAMTSALARSSAQKVFPAMYIEEVSELAFNDVVPEDPDFPYIQGLAEAGLIASNLSRHDANQNGRSTDPVVFLPDSPLSRQDLVSWKVALESHDLQPPDKQKLKAQTRFTDIDQINDDALPYLAIDYAAGERSIISTTFGFTRRFQPGKPVTRGQAAMALVTGEAADVVAEELTRLEADDIAEAAVSAELALEVRAQKHVDEYFNTELKLEKEARVTVENALAEVKHELERMVTEREDQRISTEAVRAALQAERDLLRTFRQDMEEQLDALTTLKAEAGIEKDRLETLRKEAEGGGLALADQKAQVEIEKHALMLTRLWAEDEAKKARAHGKMLEEARKRWEGKGIEVKVSKEMDDENIPALGWQYSGPNTELNKFVRQPPMQDFLAKAGALKSRVVARFYQLVQAVIRVLAVIRLKISESIHFVRERGGDSMRETGVKARLLQQDSFSLASKKAQEVQDATRSTVVGVSSKVTEGTRKMADGLRGEAQKIAGKFKG